MAATHDQSSARVAAVGAAATRYWLRVYPCVRHEVHVWRRRARAIASPGLRAAALQNLDGERPNLEGAAAFATFIARLHRRRVIRAQVAFQAAYDYADTLAEAPSHRQIENARQLHMALLVAVAAEARHYDYYAHHTERDDSGYLIALTETTRASLIALPSYRAVSQALRSGAARIVQYQAHIGEPQRLAAWIRAYAVPDAALAWWEATAACGSSLAVFALMASAAKSKLAGGELASIERAYFPWIGALHTLLDSVIDHGADHAAGRPSLVDYYGSVHAMVERLTWLAVEARRQAQELSNGSDHSLILVGMVSLYLSSADTSQPPGRLVRTCLIEAMGRPIWLTLATFHARHLVTRPQLWRR